MTMYLVLLALLIALLAVALKFDRWEMLAPSSLAMLGLSAAVLLAFVGFGTWNEVALGGEVFAVVLVGCACLVAGAVGANLAFDRLPAPTGGRLRWPNAPRFAMEHESALRKIVYILVLAVLLAALALRIAETYEIAAELGISGDGYFAIAKGVRQQTASFLSGNGIALDEGYSVLERQLGKVASAAGYVALFFAVRRFGRAGSFRERLGAAAPCLVLVLLSCAFSFAGGGRGGLVAYALAAVFFVFADQLENSLDARRLSSKTFAACFVLAVVLASLFYASSFVLGRGASSGIVEYVSFYFGCGVPSLQLLVETGIPDTFVPGSRVFYNLIAFLYKFGLAADPGSSVLGWFSLGEHSSNVFTAFGVYYAELGMAGVVLLSAVAGFALTSVYRLARRHPGSFLVVLAGYFAPKIFDMARDDFFFKTILAPSGALTVAFMLGVYALIAFWDSGWLGAGNAPDASDAPDDGGHSENAISTATSGPKASE